MKIRLAGCAAAWLLLTGVVLAGEEANPYGEVLRSRAPAVVSVKFVLNVNISFGPQSQSEEMNQEATGVMIDPQGLVMINNDVLSGGMGRIARMNPRVQVKATPSKFKVIFPGDAKEYDAILGATDSKLNLAFVRIRDLEGKEAAWVDFGNPGTVAVGQELIGVSRYGKGFDYAPYFGRSLVTGEVVQPRPMFAVDRAAGNGLPLFDHTGKPVGVTALQEGASGASEGGGGGMMGLLGGGGGSNQDLFLIPADVVQETVEQAKKQAAEALAKAAEEGGDQGDKEEGDEDGDEGEEDDGGGSGWEDE